jgi:kinesin family protein 18/19
MLGTLQSPGVMVLTLEDMFDRIDASSEDSAYKVSLSYLEIYNEVRQRFRV